MIGQIKTCFSSTIQAFPHESQKWYALSEILMNKKYTSSLVVTDQDFTALADANQMERYTSEITKG